MFNIKYWEIVSYIEDNGYKNITLFSEPTYETAFMGISNDERAVYDYDKMVEFLIKEHSMDVEEAMDFISFNDSFSSGNTPIILYNIHN